MNNVTGQQMTDYVKREVAQGPIYVWGRQGQRGGQKTYTEFLDRFFETSGASEPGNL